MGRTVITMSRTIFFCLLAHAPEELQLEHKENARIAIPALRLHRRRHLGRFAEEELWDR